MLKKKKKKKKVTTKKIHWLIIFVEVCTISDEQARLEAELTECIHTQHWAAPSATDGYTLNV